MVCHMLLEGQGWSPDHPDLLPLLPIPVLDIVESTLNLMTHGRMHEISTFLLHKLVWNWTGK